MLFLIMEPNWPSRKHNKHVEERGKSLSEGKTVQDAPGYVPRGFLVWEVFGSEVTKLIPDPIERDLSEFPWSTSLRLL